MTTMPMQRYRCRDCDTLVDDAQRAAHQAAHEQAKAKARAEAIRERGWPTWQEVEAGMRAADFVTPIEAGLTLRNKATAEDTALLRRLLRLAYHAGQLSREVAA